MKGDTGYGNDRGVPRHQLETTEESTRMKGDIRGGEEIRGVSTSATAQTHCSLRAFYKNDDMNFK